MLKPQDVQDIQHKKEEQAEYPAVEDIMEYVFAHAQEVIDILHERGKQYGEQTLVELGEEGVARMIRMKALRAIHSINQDDRYTARRDSWIDIAGYALLAIALEQWKEESKL
jgi:hypothetical protein